MGKIINIDIIKVCEIAFSIASLTMFQKIANILSIASFILITSTLGSAFFGYKYLSSEQFKGKIMNQILNEVKSLLPNVLDKGLPDMTGPSIPTPLPKQEVKF